MPACSPSLRAKRKARFFPSCLLLISGAIVGLSGAGCQSHEESTSTKPNFGPPMQDVRTEAKIIEMENEYNAAKNSQPTHQAEAQAEAAKKAREKKEKEKNATAPETPAPEPGK